MKLSIALLSTFAGLALAMPSKSDISARKLMAAEAYQARSVADPSLQRRNNTGGSSKKASITFSNPKAKNYYVDGTSIPDVDFDVGPSWQVFLAPHPIPSLEANVVSTTGLG